MASRYPAGLDEFRAFLDKFDDLVAQDLNDMFDAILAIENELGVEPSGDLGTIFSRIFARGHFSKVDGGWVPVQCAVYENRDAAEYFGEENWGLNDLSLAFRLDDNRWFGDLGWEDDSPTVFANGTTGNLDRTGTPWGMVVVEIGPAHFRMIGRDARGEPLQASNTAEVRRFGVLAWAVDTAGTTGG